MAKKKTKKGAAGTKKDSATVSQHKKHQKKTVPMGSAASKRDQDVEDSPASIKKAKYDSSSTVVKGQECVTTFKDLGKPQKPAVVDSSALRPNKLDRTLSREDDAAPARLQIKPLKEEKKQTRAALMHNAKKFVFPNQKFLDDDDEICKLSNKKSLAYYLCTRCNVPEQHMKKWWKANFKVVIDAFKNKRNYYTNKLKQAFLGKFPSNTHSQTMPVLICCAINFCVQMM
jgi:hypothetical protein